MLETYLNSFGDQNIPICSLLTATSRIPKISSIGFMDLHEFRVWSSWLLSKEMFLLIYYLGLKNIASWVIF